MARKWYLRERGEFDVAKVNSLQWKESAPLAIKATIGPELYLDHQTPGTFI